MNVAAVASSFGIVVAIFQWGWGSELLGLGSAGPIEPFLPVIMVSVLFGLSMDYQVFLVSRMYEEWLADRRQPPGRTGRPRRDQPGDQLRGRHHDLGLPAPSSSAATGSSRCSASALAAAVALDAFVLRTLLVPALMHLLGGANWWLPRWLDRWLPRISIEPPPDEWPRRPACPRRPARTRTDGEKPLVGGAWNAGMRPGCARGPAAGVSPCVTRSSGFSSDSQTGQPTVDAHGEHRTTEKRTDDEKTRAGARRRRRERRRMTWTRHRGARRPENGRPPGPRAGRGQRPPLAATRTTSHDDAPPTRTADPMDERRRRPGPEGRRHDAAARSTSRLAAGAGAVVAAGLGLASVTGTWLGTIAGRAADT